MTLALLCQFTAQHVSDVNTSIFRSLRLLGALLCRLYCANLGRAGVMLRDWLLVMWYPSAGWTILVAQPALGYHITNSQSRNITPARPKLAQYSLHNNAPSSRKLLTMDVLTSETCWAVNWHNEASVIKLIYLYSNVRLYWITKPYVTWQRLPTLCCIWYNAGFNLPFRAIQNFISCLMRFYFSLAKFYSRGSLPLFYIYIFWYNFPFKARSFKYMSTLHFRTTHFKYVQWQTVRAWLTNTNLI